MTSDTPHGAGEETPGSGGQSRSAAIRLIADTLDRLRFGAIQLTVHDGKLVQVDVTERTRFPA